MNALMAGLACLAAALGAAELQHETRAARLTAERAEKAAARVPYASTRPEAILFEIEDRYWVERVLNAPRGVFLRIGGLPTGSGLAFGPAYRYATHTASVTLSGAVSTRRYADLAGTLAFPKMAGGHAFAEITGRRRDFPQEDFYGLGPASSGSTQTSFAFRETSVLATGGVEPTPGVRIGLTIGFAEPRIGRGRDARVPSIEDLFSDLTAPGLAAQPAFVRAGGRLDLDLTDQRRGSAAGGLYHVAYDRFSDRDLDGYSFHRWTVDLRQYVPVLAGARTLALRGRFESLSPVAGHTVPFYLQPTLGGPDSARGLRSYRLRDRNLVLLQAEYRWYLNAFLSGVFFYDAGTVAPRPRALALRAFTHDYGLGLRMGFLSRAFLRAELILGDGDAPVFLVRFGDVF